MAVYSMTGYANVGAGSKDAAAAALHGAAPDVGPDGAGAPALSVEIRSVNGRFLDLSFKLPDEFRTLEPQLRELLTARFKRGKIEMRVASRSEADPADRAPDVAQLDRLAQLEALVSTRLKHARGLSVYEALQWCRSSAPTERADDTRVLALAARCIESLAEARAREGARLAAILLDRVELLRSLAERAEPLVPAAVQRQQQRFLERWRDALEASGAGESVSREASVERALNEAAAYAIRVDVAEELGRLRSHLDELARLIDAGGEIGKRLDFLIQELLREANTLGSKSSSFEMTGIAVDMKVAIEQLREQVQNVE
jgi:uncharacterized protein (TIGR00255 family)